MDYSEFFSVLMYYGGMSKEEIMRSSRPFLFGIYKQYINRASENLGVNPNDDGEPKHARKTGLEENDYPVEFKKLSQIEKDRAVNQYSSDEEFLANFVDM